MTKHVYRQPLTEEEYQKVLYIMHHSPISITDIILQTINDKYDELYTPPPTKLEVNTASNLTPALMLFIEYLKGDNRND